MLNHPTIVHTVADLRREELLAEAVSTSRVSPASTTRRRLARVVPYLVAQVANVISRVVDDFEPALHSPSAQTGPVQRPERARPWTL